MEYKIIVETTDKALDTSVAPLDKEQVVDDKVGSKQKKPPKQKSNDLLQVVAKAAEVYSFSQTIADNVVQGIGQRYQFSGETRKARQLNTTYSNITQNAQLGIGVGMTLLTGNPLGIAMSAFQIAQRAYQLSLQTQRYTFEQSKDSYRSQYLSQRLVRNISEVR